MHWIIGIDEVGRGCLAGPVTVAAVALPAKLKVASFKLKIPLKDSKRLTAKQREAWFGIIKNHPRVLHARANVYPKIIDRINISQAANLAATRAFRKLIEQHRLTDKKLKVYLDGGLFLNLEVPRAKTIVKGDEKFNAIKLASIVAKVSRDRIIARHHREFPVYGFAEHKGYGTRQHIRAIKKHGPSEFHRLTFIKNFYNM